MSSHTSTHFIFVVLVVVVLLCCNGVFAQPHHGGGRNKPQHGKRPAPGDGHGHRDAPRPPPQLARVFRACGKQAVTLHCAEAGHAPPPAQLFQCLEQHRAQLRGRCHRAYEAVPPWMLLRAINGGRRPTPQALLVWACGDVVRGQCAGSPDVVACLGQLQDVPHRCEAVLDMMQHQRNNGGGDGDSPNGDNADIQDGEIEDIDEVLDEALEDEDEDELDEDEDELDEDEDEDELDEDEDALDEDEDEYQGDGDEYFDEYDGEGTFGEDEDEDLDDEFDDIDDMDEDDMWDEEAVGDFNDLDVFSFDEFTGVNANAVLGESPNDASFNTYGSVDSSRSHSNNSDGGSNLTYLLVLGAVVAVTAIGVIIIAVVRMRRQRAVHVGTPRGGRRVPYQVLMVAPSPRGEHPPPTALTSHNAVGCGAGAGAGATAVVPGIPVACVADHCHAKVAIDTV